AATGGTLSAVEKQQALALKLHGRVTAQNLRIAEALERVRQERDLVLSRLLQRDSPPVWSPAAREGSGRLDSAESWHAQRATLETYVARHADRLVLHAVLLLLLAASLYRVRAHVAAS